MATPGAGVPLIVCPFPLTPVQAAYYAEDLQFPRDAPIVCFFMGPLDAYDPRLAGVEWTVLGVKVDLTPELPSYPFLRLTLDDGQAVQVQVWLWQIRVRGELPWVEHRWRPGEEPTISLLHLHGKEAIQKRQRARLDRALKLTLYHTRAGRTVGTGILDDRPPDDLLATLEELIRAEWNHGPRPKPKRILQLWSAPASRRTVERFVKKHRGVTLDDMIDHFRPR